MIFILSFCNRFMTPGEVLFVGYTAWRLGIPQIQSLCGDSASFFLAPLSKGSLPDRIVNVL